MVVIHCAYTEPINPSGVTPILTRKQVWNGLQRKIRRAQDFVPIITGCDVLEDKGEEVTRIAHFSNGKDVKEVCKSYWPTKVDQLLVYQCCTYTLAGRLPPAKRRLDYQHSVRWTKPVRRRDEYDIHFRVEAR